MSEKMKKRFEGCLIGGAVGDALGYPVEFLTEQQIFFGYGEKGICTLEESGNPAVISDDTQMTLFAANAIIHHRKHPKLDWNELIRIAYREWYATQTGDDSLLVNGKPQMDIYYEKRLHKRRAPGNTCMSAIRNYIENPKIKFAENNSKGCGTVMRAAPYGLAGQYNPECSYGDATRQTCMMSRYDALLTHGHEDAWKASVTLATIIFYIVHYYADRTDKRLQDIIDECLRMWAPESCVRKAIALAEDTTVDDSDAIHQLGEGWVADEALAIAIFCSVRYQNDFSRAIRAAVNHKGDSDSTGAICGNILGAWIGIDEVKKAFDLQYLEMQELIMKTADELYYATEGKKLSSDSEPIELGVKKIPANDDTVESGENRQNAVPLDAVKTKKSSREIKSTATYPKISGGQAYSLAYVQGYNGAKRTCRPGSKTAGYDQSSGKWRLRIQLDEAGIWFLSVFVRNDGRFEKYSLDQEAGNDSHYVFRDERGLRKSIYAPGDENKYLAEVLIRYVNMYGGDSLVSALSPFVTAQFHYD